MVPRFTLWAHSGSVGLYPQSYLPFSWRVGYICRWVALSAHFPPEKIQKSECSPLVLLLSLSVQVEGASAVITFSNILSISPFCHGLQDIGQSPGFCWDGSMCHPANHFIQRQSSHALELLSRAHFLIHELLNFNIICSLNTPRTSQIIKCWFHFAQQFITFSLAFYNKLQEEIRPHPQQ